MRHRIILATIIALLNLTINSSYAMVPGYAMIVECPHCRGTKERLTLESGNTLVGHQWWDLKQDYPMLPHVSFVQKCLHCQKYYILKDAKQTEGNDYSFELGKLDYVEMRRAWDQMKDTLQGESRIQLLLEYVWAYNDAFQRQEYHNEPLSPREETVLRVCPRTRPIDFDIDKAVKEIKQEFIDTQIEFETVIRELVASFPVKNRLIHAEFLREAGFFDEAMAIVEQEGEQQEEPYKTLEEILHDKCTRKDSSVGIISYQ